MKSKTRSIGLIAGSGELPLAFARNARAAGEEVAALGFRGITSKRLQVRVSTMSWVTLGQLGRMVHVFRSKGVRRVVMQGQVKLSSIYSVRPDWQGLGVLMGLRNYSGEAIMRAVGKLLLKNKIRLIDCRTYMQELLPGRGILNRVRIGAGVRRDLGRALKAAKNLASQEIGQAAVCKHGLIVALEGMEGTDACIRRAGKIAGKGCSIVKVSSAAKDYRFDVPVVGPRTLRGLRSAGFRALGLEAGKSFMLGGEAFLQEAKKYGIAVVGF